MRWREAYRNAACELHADTEASFVGTSTLNTGKLFWKFVTKDDGSIVHFTAISWPQCLTLVEGVQYSCSYSFSLLSPSAWILSNHHFIILSDFVYLFAFYKDRVRECWWRSHRMISSTSQRLATNYSLNYRPKMQIKNNIRNYESECDQIENNELSITI